MSIITNDGLRAHLDDNRSVTGRKMFVVKGVAVSPFNNKSFYTTDPYCVWKEDDHFARWPHPFPPTHFCLLPE